MTATLTKTWRKDHMGLPVNLSAVKDCNGWLLWATKELLLLGNNGVKGGPNAWTMVGSCDSTQFAMDGTDYLTDYTKMKSASTSSNRTWFVLRNAALGGGSGLEVCIIMEDDTTYYYEITLVYSWSAGFTGGALNARPTATDEVVILDKSTEWMSRSSYRQYNVCRLFSTDGEVSRIIAAEGGVVQGVMCFEKLANPATWLDKNFVIYTDSDSPDDSDVVTADAWYANINGTLSRLRTATLGSISNGSLVWDMAGFQQPDHEGKWPMVKANAYCVTPPHSGKAGEFFDLYTVPNVLTGGYLLPGAGGEKEFVVYSGIAYGNDGTAMRV